jgi:hypothetical protein
VVRSAPAGGSDWQDIFDDMVEGWIAFTEQLRFALTRHPGQPRRTIFLAGAPRTQGATNGLPALGLDQAPAPGGRWDGPLGPQPSLQGEGWHRGRFQVGLTVKEWGDGLLVVTGQQGGKRFPNGDTTVTVTTYGLESAAFTALNERWTAWWETHFVPRSVTGEAPTPP